MSESSTGRIVRYVLDPNKPYQPSAEELARLAAMRDEDIDLSDIPEQTGIAGWKRPGLSGRASRRLLVVEEDIAQFFQADSENPAERMNAVLREYVEAHRKTA